MEVLTRPPPHQDAPMDLSTTARRMLGRSSWTRHAQVECAVEPRTKTKLEGPNRYIPIPKKRHCHAPQPQGSPRRECQSPSPVRQSPPAKLRARQSLSPEMSRKRARMESPKPSDLCCASAVQLPPAAARNDVIPTSATSPSTAVSANDSRGEWPAVGAGLAGANGEVVVAGEGVSQSVMKPRQRGHSSSAESSYDRSPPSLREDNSEGMPPAHVFTALLQMQSAAMSHGMLPSALKDTEALLSAVHQSQMLYYSYCSQLIHTLRAKQIEQQTQQPQQHHHSHHDHQLNHYPLARQQQQHQHQLHQHRRFHQQKQPRHHHERTPEQPRLSSESDSERRTPLEEARNYESEDTEEDFHTAEDDTLSILRTRLNSQEAQQLCLEQMSPSAESPSGTLPSSTTGGEDMDQSQMEASGGTRKRAPRALTGKHVRPGTGASASTLITLRQKLQERQKYREVYGVDPPQPTKTTKGRAKKR